MLRIYGIPNCNKIKQTLDWLDKHSVKYDFINLKKKPLSPDELVRLIHYVGLDTLINKKGMMYKKLELKDKTLSDDELTEVLYNHQNMMKRPVLDYNDQILVGYDEDAFTNFLDL